MIDYLQQYNKLWAALAMVVALYLVNNADLGLSPESINTLNNFLYLALPAGVWGAKNKPLSKQMTAGDYVTQVRDAAETQELK